LVRHT